MVARQLLSQGLRLGTVAVMLGAAFSPADVAAQLPVAGSDPDKPAAVVEDGGVGVPDPQLLSRNEMVSLADKYAGDIATCVAKVEVARKEAQIARDLIKVSCIDHLLPEMRMIRDALAPRFTTIASRNDDFTARADFLVISPGMMRVRELRDEAETCVGEAIDTSRVFSISAEIPPGNEDSHTIPPAHDVIIERPTEASIYQ